MNIKPFFAKLLLGASLMTPLAGMATVNIGASGNTLTLRFAGLQADGPALFAMLPGQRVVLRLAGMGDRIFIHERHTAAVNGVAAWYGHLANDASVRLALSAENGKLAAVLSCGEAKGQPGVARSTAQPATDDTFIVTNSGLGVGRYSFAINSMRLANLPANGEIALRIPAAATEVIVYERSESGPAGTTLVGYSRDAGNSYRTVLTYNSAGVNGVISTLAGNYRVVTQHGMTVLIAPNTAG